MPHHLSREEALALPVSRLADFGRMLFAAVWTDQDGAGRPLTKGTGESLTDAGRPLVGAAAVNRVSGPDANACSGCHNSPYAIPGGGGDIVANVFVGAERFDSASFDRADARPTRGSVDEAGQPVTLQTIGNSRATPGLFGAGYLEMLAREMTVDLQQARDQLRAGQEVPLLSKGVAFGVLRRRRDGTWDTSGVEGLPDQSLRTAGGAKGPSLAIRPWRQSGTVASLHDFVNDAFNQHHGIQSVERFGVDTDPDGDGVRNEMTRGDVTAVAAFMATLPVPGRVIPNEPAVERMVLKGERLFSAVGCARCHVPALPLSRGAWTDAAAGSSNPRGEGSTATASIDLADSSLPLPRLAASAGRPDVIEVPAFTDFKLHDITDAADTAAAEPLDINQPRGSAAYRRGNRRFLTRRLWGAANEPPFFHHGLFTTLREAVLAHAGEAVDSQRAFQSLPKADQDAIIGFLNSLQILPPGTKGRVVDERYQPRAWPPKQPLREVVK